MEQHVRRTHPIAHAPTIGKPARPRIRKIADFPEMQTGICRRAPGFLTVRRICAVTAFRGQSLLGFDGTRRGVSGGAGPAGDRWLRRHGTAPSGRAGRAGARRTSSPSTSSPSAISMSRTRGDLADEANRSPRQPPGCLHRLGADGPRDRRPGSRRLHDRYRRRITRSPPLCSTSACTRCARNRWR